MEHGFIKCGSDFYGCVGNVYASVRIGSPVLIDEGDGAVAPADREGCEFVSLADAPAEVRRRLDPAYNGPVSRLAAAVAWTSNDTFDVAEDGTATVQSYIDGGRYGVMGTVGKDDWCVVHASDGVQVSENNPLTTMLDEQSARTKAEMMQDDE